MRSASLFPVLVGLLMIAGCSGSQQSQSSASPSASASTAASPSASATTTVAFTDIAGIFAEQDIKDEAALGVFDSTSGAFNPAAPVSRADFVRWLVKADDAYFASDPAHQIRKAESGAATFVDVPASDPNFAYIQGLANAGYVIGKDKTHFAPSVPISRQEMISIKTQVDEAQALPSSPSDLQFIPYTDKSTIAPGFTGAIYADRSARSTGNIARVWGSTKVLQPRAPVTRAEAALALAVIGSGGYASEPVGSAAVALGRTAPPPSH